MIAQGWSVRAMCWTCRTEQRVDLVAIAKLRGAHFSLWDKRGRCKLVRCCGKVEFTARAPGMGEHQTLRTPKDDDGLY